MGRPEVASPEEEEAQIRPRCQAYYSVRLLQTMIRSCRRKWHHLHFVSHRQDSFSYFLLAILRGLVQEST